MTSRQPPKSSFAAGAFDKLFALQEAIPDGAKAVIATVVSQQALGIGKSVLKSVFKRPLVTVAVAAAAIGFGFAASKAMTARAGVKV